MEEIPLPTSCLIDYLPSSDDAVPQRGPDVQSQAPDAQPGLQELVAEADRWAQRLYYLDWKALDGDALRLALGDDIGFIIDCCMALVAQVRTAAEGTGPSMLLNSPQQLREFCHLLGRLQLLNTLRTEMAAAAGRRPDGTDPEDLPSPEVFAGDAAGEVMHQQLSQVPGSHAILAALVQKVLEQLQEAPQQPHSAILSAALPVLLRQYLHAPGRQAVIKAGKPEPLALEQLERCLLQLQQTPVLAGYGDVVMELSSGVLEDWEWRRVVQQHPRLSGMQPKDQATHLQQLEQGYSLHHALPDVRKQHDKLCDQLSLLALEIGAIKHDKERKKLPLDPKVAADVSSTTLQALHYVRTMHAKLLAQDAWRLHQAKEDSTGTRWELDSSQQLRSADVLSVLETLTAIKGISTLFSDSQDWLLPHVQRHCVLVLDSIYHQVLPLAAKTAHGNARVSKLVRAIQTCLSDDAHVKELEQVPADLWVKEGRLHKAAAIGGPAAAAAADEEDVALRRADSDRQRPQPRGKAKGRSILDGLTSVGQPVGEGTEGWEDAPALIPPRPARRAAERGLGPVEPCSEDEVEEGEPAAADLTAAEEEEANGSIAAGSPQLASSSSRAAGRSPGPTMLLGKHNSNAAAIARALRTTGGNSSSSQTESAGGALARRGSSSSLDGDEAATGVSAPNFECRGPVASSEVLAAVLGSSASSYSQQLQSGQRSLAELDPSLLPCSSSTVELDQYSLSQLQRPPAAALEQDGGSTQQAPPAGLQAQKKGKWKLGKGSSLKSLLGRKQASVGPLPAGGQQGVSTSAPGELQLPGTPTAAGRPQQPESPLKRTMKALASPFETMRAKFQTASAAAAAAGATPPPAAALMQVSQGGPAADGAGAAEAARVTSYHTNWAAASSSSDASPPLAATGAAAADLQAACTAAAATVAAVLDAASNEELEAAAAAASGDVARQVSSSQHPAAAAAELLQAPALTEAAVDQQPGAQARFMGAARVAEFLVRLSPSKRRSRRAASEAGDDAASQADAFEAASGEAPASGMQRTKSRMQALSKRFSFKPEGSKTASEPGEKVPPFAARIPGAKALRLLPLLLEQLLMELRQDFNHAMLRKFMSAAQADSKFEPTRKVQEALQEVQAMAGLLAYPQELTAASDVSHLWLSRRAAAAAAAQEGAGQQQGLSFTALLVQGACRELHAMPAETPLAAGHIWKDAWRVAGALGLSQEQEAIQAQMGAAVESYLEVLGHDVYEHFKRLAAGQVLDSDLLERCRAGGLPPVLPFLFDTLLEGAAWDAVWPQRTGDENAFVPFATIMQQQKLLAGAGSGGCGAEGVAHQSSGFVPITRTQVQHYLMISLDDMFGAETERLRSAFSECPASCIVEVSTQLKVLQRAHLLLGECLALPRRWSQLWPITTTEDIAANNWRNDAAEACVHRILDMLRTAAFDSHAQLFLPDAAASSDSAAWDRPDGSGAEVGEVQVAVAKAMAPFRAFFGRQHLHALQQLGGEAALWALRAGVVEQYRETQAELPGLFSELQCFLPDQADLRRGPDPSSHHDAISVHTSYHTLLEPALQQPQLCQAALGHLQHAGNCLAMLHLLSVQRSWTSTAQFMQVAPLLGIWADPGQDGKGLQLADACLRMPAVPDPTSRSNSHFERMVLGPVAQLVRGVPLGIVQAGELRAWDATRGWDLLPPAMSAVAAAADEVQALTAASWEHELERREALRALQAAAAAAAAQRAKQEEEEGQQGAQEAATQARHDSAQYSRGQQSPHGQSGSMAGAGAAGATPARGVPRLHLQGDVVAEPVAGDSPSSLQGVVRGEASGSGGLREGTERSTPTPAQGAEDAEGPWVPRSTLPSPGPFGDGLVVVQLSTGQLQGAFGAAAAQVQAAQLEAPAAEASGATSGPEEEVAPAAEASAGMARAAEATRGAADDGEPISTEPSGSASNSGDASALSAPEGEAVPTPPISAEASSAADATPRSGPMAAVPEEGVPVAPGKLAANLLRRQSTGSLGGGSTWAAATADEQQALATAMQAADMGAPGMGPLGLQGSREDVLSAEGSLGSKRSARLLEAMPELLGQMTGGSRSAASSTINTARSTGGPTMPAPCATTTAAASHDSDQGAPASSCKADMAAQDSQPDMATASEGDVMMHIIQQDLLMTKQRLSATEQKLSEATATVERQNTLLQMVNGCYLETPRNAGSPGTTSSQRDSVEPDPVLAAAMAAESSVPLVDEPSQTSSAAADGVAAAAWGAAAGAMQPLPEEEGESGAASAENSGAMEAAGVAAEASAEGAEQEGMGMEHASNAQMLASVVEAGAGGGEEQQDHSAASQGANGPGSMVAGDAEDGVPAQAREATFPVVHHPPPPPADVAVLVSALRYILLHQVVTDNTCTAGVDQVDQATAAAGSGSGSNQAAAAAGMGALLHGTMQSLMSSPLALKRLVTIGGSSGGPPAPPVSSVPSMAVRPGGGCGGDAPTAAGAGSTASQQQEPLREEADGQQDAAAEDGGHAGPEAPHMQPVPLVREHLAGGMYGDGPLWACSVLLNVLGQHRAAQRVDVCRALQHWYSYNALRPAPPSKAGLDNPELTQVEAAALEAQHRKEHAQHMEWLGRFAAAEARAQQVSTLASTALSARFAAAPPSASAPLSMLTLDGPVNLELTGQPDGIGMAAADQQVIKPASMPEGHGFARRSSAGGHQGLLPSTAAAGGYTTPGGQRPTYAPPKAGLVSATLAAEAVARFKSVAPSQAFSASVLRDQDGQTRRSEMASVGTWGGYSSGTATRRQSYDGPADQAMSSSKAALLAAANLKGINSSPGRLQAPGPQQAGSC